MHVCIHIYIYGIYIYTHIFCMHAHTNTNTSSSYTMQTQSMTTSDAGDGRDCPATPSNGWSSRWRTITRRSKVVGYAFARILSTENDAERERGEWYHQNLPHSHSAERINLI